MYRKRSLFLGRLGLRFGCRGHAERTITGGRRGRQLGQCLIFVGFVVRRVHQYGRRWLIVHIVHILIVLGGLLQLLGLGKLIQQQRGGRRRLRGLCPWKREGDSGRF